MKVTLFFDTMPFSLLKTKTFVLTVIYLKNPALKLPMLEKCFAHSYPKVTLRLYLHAMYIDLHFSHYGILSVAGECLRCSM
jgi:hypothetical protein